ncbi:MAG TPA: hypothetical protein DIW64_11645 [Cellvibrio sp.]|nr:hypothetical protein [Cellvibrio sp.]
MPSSPSWFKLERYLKPMSNEEWAYHIYVRSKVWGHGKFWTGTSFQEKFAYIQSQQPDNKNLLHHIRDEWSVNFANSMERDLKLFAIPDEPIGVFTVDDVYKKISKAQSEFPSLFDDESTDSVDSQIADPDNAIHREVAIDLLNLFKNSIFNERILICPSLEHTDQQILKAVKKQLKKMRSENKLIFIFKESIDETLDEFHKFRLLALFDLLYWREINNKKLTLTKIGALIWPDEFIDIEQRIRKKGLPLIKSVFHRQVAQKIFHSISVKVENEEY